MSGGIALGKLICSDGERGDEEGGGEEGKHPTIITRDCIFAAGRGSEEENGFSPFPSPNSFQQRLPESPFSIPCGIWSTTYYNSRRDQKRKRGGGGVRKIDQGTLLTPTFLSSGLTLLLSYPLSFLLLVLPPLPLPGRTEEADEANMGFSLAFSLASLSLSLRRLFCIWSRASRSRSASPYEEET